MGSIVVSLLIDVADDILSVDSEDICSLLDDVLVAITDIVEVSSLVVTAMVEVIDCTALSRLLDATLPISVTEGVKVCSPLDVALIELTNNAEEGLLLDSPLVAVTAGGAVEVVDRVSSLLNTILICGVVGEVTDGTIFEKSDTENASLLLEVALVDEIEVISFIDVVLTNALILTVLEDITDVAESRLVFVTVMLLIDGGNVTNDVVACSLLGSPLVGILVTPIISLFVTVMTGVMKWAGLSVPLDVNITDGVETCSLLEMLVIEVTNDVVFSLSVDGTLVDVTDDEDISSLLDNVLVGIVIGIVEACLLCGITLVDATDASSLFGVDLVNANENTEVSSLLEIRLVVLNDTEVCLLVDAMDEGVADSIEMFGASLIDITVDTIVEVLWDEISTLDITLVEVIDNDCEEACALLISPLAAVRLGTVVETEGVSTSLDTVLIDTIV